MRDREPVPCNTNRRTRYRCQPPNSSSTSIQAHRLDAVTSHQSFGRNNMQKKRKISLIVGAITLGLTVAIGVVWAKRNGFLWRSTIPLSDRDKTEMECPVHKGPLEIERIEVEHTIMTISYAPGVVESYWQASRELFPWANTDSYNDRYGCNNPSIGWMLRKYCRLCREAERVWISERAEQDKRKLPNKTSHRMPDQPHSSNANHSPVAGHRWT
jgi:hypothetical protein